jgi:hypothetical protein
MQYIHLLFLSAVVAVFAEDIAFANLEFDDLTWEDSLWTTDPTISNSLTFASPETDDLFGTTDPNSWELGFPDESTDPYSLGPGSPGESDLFNSLELELSNYPEISSTLLANAADDCDSMSQSKRRRSAMCIDGGEQPNFRIDYRRLAYELQDLA